MIHVLNDDSMAVLKEKRKRVEIKFYLSCDENHIAGQFIWQSSN